VPIGATGEIYVGGAGLARGYLNRPDLTLERFVPDPFSHQPGARLYKTGDLARYMPDGNLEFLGRADLQVKVRGCRIELGEIEAALSCHPAVRESVVVARRDAEGDTRLIAYVIPGQEPAAVPAELRNFLKEKLPAYMLPSAFVLLDALPLTPNGKVDRRRLQALDQAHVDLDRSSAAPRTQRHAPISSIRAAVRWWQHRPASPPS
jgi:acyl-coenzyme A synthetase/AMP-(fatty) acid ligase